MRAAGIYMTELLAPGGSLEGLKAAINAGADAQGLTLKIPVRTNFWMPWTIATFTEENCILP